MGSLHPFDIAVRIPARPATDLRLPLHSNPYNIRQYMSYKVGVLGLI